MVPRGALRGLARIFLQGYASYRAQHERLVEDGAIVVTDGLGQLTRDRVVSSPSTAGAIALGRSCNGRREWVSPQGTFAEWETRGID